MNTKVPVYILNLPHATLTTEANLTTLLIFATTLPPELNLLFDNSNLGLTLVLLLLALLDYSGTYILKKKNGQIWDI